MHEHKLMLPVAWTLSLLNVTQKLLSPNVILCGGFVYKHAWQRLFLPLQQLMQSMNRDQEPNPICCLLSDCSEEGQELQ